MLDGRPVASINANLTAGVDLTMARRLPENAGLAYLGSQKAGPFDLTAEEAYPMLDAHNPDGRSNRDVVKRRATGQAVLRARELPWVIDFGVDMGREEAALYERPFERVGLRVRPSRADNPRKRYRESWWLHAEPRPGMRAAVRRLGRFIVTPTLAKHGIFALPSASTNHAQGTPSPRPTDGCWFRHSRSSVPWKALGFSTLDLFVRPGPGCSPGEFQ